MNRVEGELVPKNLLASWRETRALFPDLFKNVKVYQNEINCARHAELLQEETGDSLVMHQVDMFSGESISSQAMTITGPKLTPTQQAIDACQSRHMLD